MAISLIAHVATGATGVSGVTTSAIDTTGANFIVVWQDSDGPSAAITDSKGNTWSRLAAVAATDPSLCFINYCFNPTVGTGHTFTAGSSYPSLFVAAFSGVSSVRTSGSNGQLGGASNIINASITPNIGEVLVTTLGNFVLGGTYTINQSFAIIDQLPAVSVQHYGGALATLMAVSTTALNPTWTFSGTSSTGATAYIIALAASSDISRSLTDSISILDSKDYSINSENLRIVQKISARADSTSTIVAVMPMDVTAGNLLVVMTGNYAGGDSPTVATISDTRSLTFTKQIQTINVSGNQSASTIYTAPITSSGPETITRSQGGSSNYPISMWVIEVAGMPNFIVPSVNGGTADGGTTVNSNNVTSANPNLLLVAVGSDSHPSNFFDSWTPSGSNVANVGIEGIFLAKFVGPGTYNATFSKSGTGQRFSASAALISVPLGVIGVGDSVSLSDSVGTTIGNLVSTNFLAIDVIGLSDEIVASFTLDTPPVLISALHPFEFYGMDMPEDVEILPVPKKYDQVGPIRFDKIGKIFGFRVRLIASGITESMPYKIYGDDSESLDHLNSPLFADEFRVRPGLDNVYEIQLPKSVNTDIFRMTFGPVDFPFYRYDVLIKVHISGMRGQAKWIPIR